jgi:hypothetical protein
MPAPTTPKAVAVEVVATQPTEADRAALTHLSARGGKELPPVAYVVKVRLQSMPPVTSRGWALYVNDFRIPKYWEYREGIYFKIFDPQFFVDHQGERLRFSQDGRDFVDTRVRLSPPASRARKGSRPVAAKLPLQADVLK